MTVLEKHKNFVICEILCWAVY